ncbi:phosphohistidine phosphatase SixA [SAR116 cluster alpha proteobacterium HIMB100]|nr:phosphohistidine phosphatase SixA [SAR116 cluster alpha proteobacterium HIMB100]
MKRLKHFAYRVGLGLMVMLFLPLTAANADTSQDPVRAALTQTGANVVFMRHALAPGYGDPDNFRIDDCDTQRNLDAAGRRQAEAIGHYFRDHQLTFTAILSSRWCRCTQTAELLNLGDWAEFDGLNSFFQGHVDRQKTLGLLRDKLDSLSADDQVLMITHQVVISAITGISPPSGGLVVYNTSTQNAKAVSALHP